MSIMKEKPLLQKHPIVILPTNDAVKTGSILLNSYTKKIGRAIGLDKHVFPYVVEPTQERYPLPSVVQHLYVLSNEEIKDGDWYIDQFNDLYQHTTRDQDDLRTRDQKVIATTDPALWYKPNLPEEGYKSIKETMCAKLPIDFILAYIKSYNAATPIEEILVEYKPDRCNNSGGQLCITTTTGKCDKCSGGLNLRPDGSIIIHPVKERMFTLQQLTEAFDAARETGKVGVPYSYDDMTYDTVEDWLKENYPD